MSEQGTPLERLFDVAMAIYADGGRVGDRRFTLHVEYHADPSRARDETPYVATATVESYATRDRVIDGAAYGATPEEALTELAKLGEAELARSVRRHVEAAASLAQTQAGKRAEEG